MRLPRGKFGFCHIGRFVCEFDEIISIIITFAYVFIDISEGWNERSESVLRTLVSDTNRIIRPKVIIILGGVVTILLKPIF